MVKFPLDLNFCILIVSVIQKRPANAAYSLDNKRKSRPPNGWSAKITFDLGLASRIYAGGDIYLMPSKSEPCGLSQMNAMRYGTVPVVHATGGLRDTVPGADQNGEGGLGFTFQSYNADDFLASLKTAIHLYRDQPAAFQALQKRGMEQDFSWDEPAGKYMEQFHRMLCG